MKRFHTFFFFFFFFFLSYSPRILIWRRRKKTHHPPQNIFNIHEHYFTCFSSSPFHNLILETLLTFIPCLVFQYITEDFSFWLKSLQTGVTTFEGFSGYLKAAIFFFFFFKCYRTKYNVYIDTDCDPEIKLLWRKQQSRLPNIN